VHHTSGEWPSHVAHCTISRYSLHSIHPSLSSLTLGTASLGRITCTLTSARLAHVFSSSLSFFPFFFNINTTTSPEPIKRTRSHHRGQGIRVRRDEASAQPSHNRVTTSSVSIEVLGSPLAIMKGNEQGMSSDVHDRQVDAFNC